MSEVHLGKGSTHPPLVEGKWRLYSMKFCPYAQRCRMILILKQVPHDIVNVDLKNKPEWLFEIHPDAKVPILDDGMGIILESLDIVNYIERKYEPFFYSDPRTSDAQMKKDKELIKEFDEVIKLMMKCYNVDDKIPVEEKLKPVLEKLGDFEKNLAEKGTTYFAGNDNPGMVDYMIWPWCERIKSILILYKSDYEIPRENFPKLNAWRKAMMDAPGVKETYLPAEKHAAFITGYLAGKPNYDP